MERKVTLGIVAILLLPFIIKAEWVSISKTKTTPTPPTVTLISNDNSSSILKIDISGFDLQNINANGREYQMADLLTEYFVTKPGFPGLPTLPYIAKTFAIPDHATVSYEILETDEFQTFHDISLAPARESWQEGNP